MSHDARRAGRTGRGPPPRLDPGDFRPASVVRSCAPPNASSPPRQPRQPRRTPVPALALGITADLGVRAAGMKKHPLCGEPIDQSPLHATHPIAATDAQATIAKSFAPSAPLHDTFSLAEAQGKQLCAHSVLMDFITELGTAVNDSLPMRKSTVKPKGMIAFVLLCKRTGA